MFNRCLSDLRGVPGGMARCLQLAQNYLDRVLPESGILISETTQDDYAEALLDRDEDDEGLLRFIARKFYYRHDTEGKWDDPVLPYRIGNLHNVLDCGAMLALSQGSNIDEERAWQSNEILRVRNRV